MNTCTKHKNYLLYKPHMEASMAFRGGLRGDGLFSTIIFKDP